MEIPEDKIEEIMSAHLETVNEIKDERDKLKADAEKTEKLEEKVEQLKKEFRRYAKHKDIEKLKAEIKSWAMYCFWSKCEYEIILTSFPERKDFKQKKVDVYQQLMLNWDSFVEYVLENKAYFLRRELK